MSRLSYELGRQGEESACIYLQQQGFKIIGRNFRSHQGEIDIVARDGKYLVFVEVKSYSHRSLSSPIYAVQKDKRGSIIHAARFYLHKNKLYDEPCRFDVVAIYKKLSGETIIDHIKNAFGIK